MVWFGVVQFGLVWFVWFCLVWCPLLVLRVRSINSVLSFACSLRLLVALVSPWLMCLIARCVRSCVACFRGVAFLLVLLSCLFLVVFLRHVCQKTTGAIFSVQM